MVRAMRAQRLWLKLTTKLEGWSRSKRLRQRAGGQARRPRTNQQPATALPAERGWHKAMVVVLKAEKSKQAKSLAHRGLQTDGQGF